MSHLPESSDGAPETFSRPEPVAKSQHIPTENRSAIIEQVQTFDEVPTTDNPSLGTKCQQATSVLYGTMIKARLRLSCVSSVLREWWAPYALK